MWREGRTATSARKVRELDRATKRSKDYTNKGITQEACTRHCDMGVVILIVYRM
jgi:hypothetical protein